MKTGVHTEPSQSWFRRERGSSQTLNNDVLSLLSTPTIVALDFGISSFQREVRVCLRHQARPVFTHAWIDKLGCPCMRHQTAKDREGDTIDRCCSIYTSPQPFADVTLLKARLMVPPPFPLCVDKEPDKIAVSFVVRGACSDTNRTRYRPSLYNPHLKKSRWMKTNITSMDCDMCILLISKWGTPPPTTSSYSSS